MQFIYIPTVYSAYEFSHNFEHEYDTSYPYFHSYFLMTVMMSSKGFRRLAMSNDVSLCKLINNDVCVSLSLCTLMYDDFWDEALIMIIM